MYTASIPVTDVLVNLEVWIEVELGVSVVLFMMVSLVFAVGCTVEVVDIVVSTSDVVVETDEVVRVVDVAGTDAVIKVGDEVVEIVRVVGFAEVVDADKVDIINDKDIIDGVVNTVDVSDTDDEWTDDIRTEDVEPLVILIPVITAEWLVKQEYKFTNSHAYSVKLLPAGMLSAQWIKFNWSLGGIR